MDHQSLNELFQNVHAILEKEVRVARETGESGSLRATLVIAASTLPTDVVLAMGDALLEEHKKFIVDVASAN